MSAPTKKKPGKVARLEEALQAAHKESAIRLDRIRMLEPRAADDMLTIRDALRNLRTQGKLILLTPSTVMVLSPQELRRPAAEAAAEVKNTETFTYRETADTTREREIREAITVITRLSQ